MSSFADSYLGKIRKMVGSFPLIVSGVRVILERDDSNILLQLRGDFDGVWGLPGGNLEYGESVTDAVSREIQEETGLLASQPITFGFSSNPTIETIQFPNGDICQFHVLLFLCKSFSGELKCDNEETLGLKWIPPEDMRKTKTLPNMLATVEAYLEYKKTSTFQLLV